jgi:hypothetical protein
MAQDNRLPYDWKNIVDPLTADEDAILQERLTHPAVIKFFKNIAYQAAIDQSMTPIEVLKQEGSQGTLINMAYYKGILDSVDNILTHLK